MEDFESTPILNRNTMQELFDMLDEDALEIFNVFIDDAPIQEAQLIDANSNHEQLILASHSLKSSSAYVGAERISMLANQIESDLRENSFKDAHALISQLPDLLNESLKQLRIAIDEFQA